MSVAATERLSRLLSMVPWLLQRQGIALPEAAAHFGITEAQLVKDLQLLFVCGTPGHMPDDLIEADWESGHVYLDNADTLARPRRFDLDEAVALIAGLRTLAEVPGLHEREAVESALDKLTAAAGEAARAAAAVTVDLGGADGQETVLAGIRRALSGRRRLHLDYLVPSRDELTSRDVDPIRLASVSGRWYLEGWCHRAEAVRLFRTDRIVALEVSDVDGTPPPQARGREDLEQLFRPGPDDLEVTLDLAPSARWVAEYYDATHVEELGEAGRGSLRVRLRAAGPEWVVRLALRSCGAVRVVAPATVVDAVRAAVTDALTGLGTGGAASAEV
ncbi:MAG: WYL domain-containing protein [Kineosporiaceae bacterium]